MFSERGAREGLLGSWPRGHAGKTSCAEGWGWERGRERGGEEKCVLLFLKSPFPTADLYQLILRGPVSHTHSVPTLVVPSPPLPQDCRRGSLGPGTGCHPALHSFIKLMYSAECQARATQSLPHTAPRPVQSQAQRNIVGYGR